MRILIVEDEVKLAEALKNGLSHHGFAVDLIHDGQKALTRITLHKSDYDLIILDLMLPSLSGDEICEKIRKEGISVPILVLTARNETDTKVKLLLSGADDYLIKPFSFEELLARVRALLRRPTKSTPKILYADDLELNTTEHTVRKNGQEVPLTLKEFALLEYLMLNQNQVVNREDLLSHVWDFNYTGFGSNVVDVHVKNIRKKLGESSGKSVLETIRGIGYRLRS